MRISGTGPEKQDLDVIFLNSDFSVNIGSIPIKSLRDVLYRSMSQNFGLGPG